MNRAPKTAVLVGPAETLAERLSKDAALRRARFSLVYVDPPYNVGKVHTARARKGHRKDGPVAYDDRFEDAHALVAMLERCVRSLVPVLAPTASVVVHMDHRAVHEAKVMLDRVLGAGSFRGEIVWEPGNGARGGGVPSTHQTLLVYAGAPDRDTRWNDEDPDLREPYAETSRVMHFRKVDEDGRRYRDRTVAGKTYRYYADQGRKRGSVWTDVPSMVANTPLRKETTGYPTQKPVRLLERLVRATTVAGEWVLDPMCGSGTTLVAARGLGRHAVGNDQSDLAVEIARGRLG